MNESWTDNIRLFLLHRLPLIATFLLIFLFAIPVYSVEFNYFRPMIGMICVYYWGLKYPHMFSYISAFCIGFWMDAHSSSPLGIDSILMMLLVFMTDCYARYLRLSAFGLVWFVFGINSLIIMLLKWLLLTLYYQHIFSLGEIMMSYFTTLMFYPLIAAINVWVQNNFLPQESIDE